MQLTYRPATETSAREFVRWKYEAPYDIYNCPQEKIEKAIKYYINPINNVYAIYDHADTLIGYCSYGTDAQVPGGDYSTEALDIGLMIKPELTGHGMGNSHSKDVIRNGIEKYTPVKLRVTIAAFNHRAIRTWEKNGFNKSLSFKRNSDGMEFVILVKKV